MDEDSWRLLLYACHGILGFKIPCLIVNLLTYALCRCLSYILIPQIANPWAYIGCPLVGGHLDMLPLPCFHPYYLDMACYTFCFLRQPAGGHAPVAAMPPIQARDRGFFIDAVPTQFRRTRMENQWKTINNHNV